MFDAEMIRACAELYPVEFACFCVVAFALITVMAILTVAMASILVGG